MGARGNYEIEFERVIDLPCVQAHQEAPEAGLDADIGGAQPALTEREHEFSAPAPDADRRGRLASRPVTTVTTGVTTMNLLDLSPDDRRNRLLTVSSGCRKGVGSNLFSILLRQPALFV